MHASISRRGLLACASCAGAKWGLVGTAWAQSTPVAVPVVDRLTVKVLTASSYDTPRVSASKWVKVKRVGLAAPGNYRKTLHNEWGLALALESQRGSETRQLLLDFGYTVEALLNNMEIMNVDPAKVQALILSHGHFDHNGGLVGFSGHRGLGGKHDGSQCGAWMRKPPRDSTSV